MPTRAQETNSSGDSIGESDPSPATLDLDLEFRDWDHGPSPEGIEDSRLALAHAAALLPSALPEILEGRNVTMNPERFVL